MKFKRKSQERLQSVWSEQWDGWSCHPLRRVQSRFEGKVTSKYVEFRVPRRCPAEGLRRQGNVSVCSVGEATEGVGVVGAEDQDWVGIFLR